MPNSPTRSGRPGASISVTTSTSTRIRHPDPWRGHALGFLEERFREHRKKKYSKRTDGAKLFDVIVRSPELQKRVYDANPSVRAMVDDLVALR
jgi:hypothetical protein